MSDMLLVITNVPDQQSAFALAEKLVSLKLAACVNCLPGIHSVYRWQGKIEQTTEVALLIKTRPNRYPELENAIRKAHPYDVPEIIALPVERGLPGYLAWVAEETSEART
jgi:periplasmic divalent cation tolerance protein